MPRQSKPLPNKKAEQARQARLAKRREAHAEKRAFEAAGKSAEGQADYDKLIAAEAKRMGVQNAQQKIAGAHRAPPKTITAARENLSLAFDLMGGVPAMVVWGRENRTEFYRIWARLIPKESVEASASLPLESLLEKLANKAEFPVAEAAWQIGSEIMEDARRKAQEEDAALLGLPSADDTIN